MKGTSKIKKIKLLLLTLLLFFGIVTIIYYIKQPPKLTIFLNGTKVIETTRIQQRKIYTLLNDISYDDNFDLNSNNAPFDYGATYYLISYEENNIIHEWKVYAAYVTYDIYIDNTKSSYGKYEANHDTFIYFGSLLFNIPPEIWEK